MRIVSVSENKKVEKRIAITPDIVKRYINLGFDISLPENYGTHLGINDELFKDAGASIVKDEKDLLTNSELIVQLGLLSEQNFKALSKKFFTLLSLDFTN